MNVFVGIMDDDLFEHLQSQSALEVSHTRLHVRGGPQGINTGLLLRHDLDALFDLRYVPITP
ncbi:MAG: HNH endonuclease [Chloroflexi bacterium]|nr:HNH endonuclease [Chloroflexota bacterium]